MTNGVQQIVDFVGIWPVVMAVMAVVLLAWGYSQTGIIVGGLIAAFYVWTTGGMEHLGMAALIWGLVWLGFFLGRVAPLWVLPFKTALGFCLFWCWVSGGFAKGISGALTQVREIWGWYLVLFLMGSLAAAVVGGEGGIADFLHRRFNIGEGGYRTIRDNSRRSRGRGSYDIPDDVPGCFMKPRAPEAPAATVTPPNQIEQWRPDEEFFVRAGYLKERAGDLLGSVEDRTRAIELNAKHVGAHLLRGRCRLGLGERLDAIRDFDRVAEIGAPVFVMSVTLEVRGIAKAWSGDLDGAIRDYTALIDSGWLSDSTAQHDAFLARGMMFLAKKKWREAGIDLRSSRDAATQQRGRFNAMCFLWVVALHSGNLSAAESELATALITATPDGEPETAQFLLGRMNEGDFFYQSATHTKDNPGNGRCEAHYFAGAKRQADGDRKGAIDHFRNCVAAGWEGALFEQCAKAELKPVVGSD